jgi:predicted amidophosphoribosyltransferase
VFLADLLDLVLPATCAGCDEPSSAALCGPCRAALAAAPPRRARPDPEPAGLPPTYALAAYAGSLRRAVVQYKEENRHELTTVLGRLLAGVVARSVRGTRGPVLLVPVPATAAAVRRRHGDHILRLARVAARSLPGARIATPLRALPKPVDSAELSARARARAAEGAFAVRRGRPSGIRTHLAAGAGAVVLVDDIVTTGVTLAAAARRLSDAGVRVDRAAVLAATQRQRRDTV